MRTFSKVLLLFLVVGLIIFGSWKTLDNILFSEEGHDKTILTEPAPIASANTNAPSISQAEAFESTSGHTPTHHNTLNCLTADPIISTLYDIRTNDKSLNDALHYLDNNEEIPEAQYDNFVNFAHILWNNPKHTLLKKEAFIQQFNASCSKIETGQ